MIAEVCPDSAAILENPAAQKTSMIIMKYCSNVNLIFYDCRHRLCHPNA